MAALLGLLMFFLLCLALRHGNAKWWIGYTATATALLYTHNYGVFIVFAGGIFTLPHLRKANVLFKAIASNTVMMILYMPWLLQMMRHQIGSTAIQGWIPPMRPILVWETFLHFSGIGMFGWHSLMGRLGTPLMIALLIIGLLPASVAALGGASSKKEAAAGQMILIYLIFGLAIPMIISVWKPIYLPFRYSIVAWPAYAVLLALGLSRLRYQWVAIMLSVLLTTVWSLSLYWFYFVYEKSADRQIAEILTKNTRVQDVIIFSPHWMAVPVNFYADLIASTVGFPKKVLANRQLQSDTAEREDRTVEKIMQEINDRLGEQGRVVLVRGLMEFEKDAPKLKAALDERFTLLTEGITGYAQISVYELKQGGGQ